jgi:methyl-accepting chemotaxis protein
MLQTNEIKQRFNSIERTINQVSQACQSNNNVPQELLDCARQLDQHTDQVRQLLQSQDQMRMLQCVDKMEEIGDRAQRACKQTSNLDTKVKDAFRQVHIELSNLKHQMH